MKQLKRTSQRTRRGLIMPELTRWSTSLFFKPKPHSPGLQPSGWQAFTSLTVATVITLTSVSSMLLVLSELAQAASVGPRFATATSDCTNGAGGTWTNPGNAFSDNSTNATVSVDGSSSGQLNCKNFGFTTSMIPNGSTINGVVVTIERMADSTGNGGSSDSALWLTKDGTNSAGSSRHTSTTYTTSMVAEGHGGAADLWGTTLSVAEVTSSNFGVLYYAQKPNGAGAAHLVSVDYISITVHYTAPVIPWTTITQRQGIITNDQNNTTLASHTAKIGERLRVITQVDTNSGASRNKVFKLQYDKNSNGTWEDVRAAGEIRPAKSSIIGLSETTGTDQEGVPLFASCSQGYMFENTNRTSSISIGGNTCHDIGFVVDTANAAVNTTYRFRLYDSTGATALNTYSGYASFTTVNSANNTTKASRSNTTSLASTASDLKALLDSQGYSNINSDDAAREMLQNISSDTTVDATQYHEGPSNLSSSISTAGDVNGDTYTDVIIGEDAINSQTGRAHIFFGGPSMDSNPDITFNGENFGDSFGVNVAGGGDLNNDTYDDVVVGASQHDNGSLISTGKIYVYFGGSSMDTTADLTIAGDQVSSFLGGEVAIATDVNGDGYDELLAGLPQYDSNSLTGNGRAYAYFGGSPMNAVADLTFDGDQANAFFGDQVASVGDVNNDTYGDIAIGAFAYDINSNVSVGRAYVYLGGSTMNNVADVTMDGENQSDNFSNAIAGGGDVNNDGYNDVVASAVGYDVGSATTEGRVYVYYGGSTMNSTADVTFTGTQPNQTLGNAVYNKLDVNNDGYSDVAIGHGYDSGSNTNDGGVYVFYGGTSMDTTADITILGENPGDNFGNTSEVLTGFSNLNGDSYGDLGVGSASFDGAKGKAYLFHGGSPMNTTVDVTMTGSGGYLRNYGNSVSNAGDVNGDGYDDIAVGARSYSLSTGQVYIYYGGQSLDLNVDITLTGEANSSAFGIAISTAGDMNGDGYDDIAIGASAYNSSTGRAYVYLGGANMDSVADLTLNGEATSDFFGFSVLGDADFNQDGYDDLVVSGKGYLTTGRVYVYYGSPTLDGASDVTIDGESTQHGDAMTFGDINGDNSPDLVVGAYGYSSNTGRVYVYYGGSTMDATADVTLTGEATIINFGFSVSGDHDLNGDGYDDLAVGVNQWDIDRLVSTSSNEGRVYVYYGGSTMDTTADITITGESAGLNFGNVVESAGDRNNDGYGDFAVGVQHYDSLTGQVRIFYGGASMDSTADVTLTGEGDTSTYGKSIDTTGDVNGDGFSDMVIGAETYANSGGKIYVYLQSNQMNNTADKTMSGATSDTLGASVASVGDVNKDGYGDVAVGAPGSFAVGYVNIYYGGPNMDTTADVTMTGEATNIGFGMSVAGAGDVNGDGYDDVIAGASGYSSGTGRAYIYYGGSSMNSTVDVTLTGEATNTLFGGSTAGAGDVNGDGYGDVVVGASGYDVGAGTNDGRAYIFYGGSSISSSIAASSANVTMTGEASNNGFGGSTAGAGDVNGDGYGDVVAGASGYSSSTGRAYIYYGGSSMNSTVDVTLTGEATFNFFGGTAAVARAGDVNGDGYGDLVVGAYNYSSNTGRAYVFYGGSSMSSSIAASSANVILNGEASSSFGSSTAGAGDVNGDGYGDVVVGARGYSGSTGRAYVFYGGSNMDNTADTTMTGEAGNNQFGQPLSIGDMNGDGYGDLVVGASGHNFSAGRSYIYLGGSSNYIPTFNLAQKHTSACSGLTSINGSWNGQSNVATSTNNLLLQVYRFGSTNAWTTVDTESALAANTDGNLTGSVTTNLSEYCDGSNWSYWRLYQASGTQTLQADDFDVSFTAGGGNVAPNSPTSPAQAKVTGGASVATGGWTNENQIRLSASATDPDASDTLQLCVEKELLGTAFDGVGEVCGTGVAYSGSTVTPYVDITGMSEGEYHWQARVKDAGGLYSSWVSYGGNAESARDYGVDTTAPTGTVYDGVATGVDAALNDGTLGNISANWAITPAISGLSGNEISVGTTPGGTNIFGWSPIGGVDTTVSANNLVTSQIYYVNIRSTDNAGNVAVISSNGQMVAPTLTFSTSSNAVNFSSLNASNSYTASQSLTLTTTTNAKNGYQVYGKATSLLTNQSSQTIAMFNGGTYASPAAWGSNTGFGYNSSDTSVGGSNRFNSATCLGGGSAPCFAPYSLIGVGDVVADSGSIPAGGPTLNDTTTITNKVSVGGATQQSGRYQTTVLYSAYATY